MADAAEAVSFLHKRCGARLAYCQLDGRKPTVVFLGGFASHMGGTKAMALENHCRDRGQAFLRFDYQGHGRSSGRFEDGGIETWSDDASTIVESLTHGPLLLVGSSMGAWIMLIVARALGSRASGLLGIASAPDFTESPLWQGLPDADRERLERDGRIELDSPYQEGPLVITRAMLAQGRRALQLETPIPVHCPVRLIHGLEDRDVPWRTSLRVLELLASADVRLVLVKRGEHRLSRSSDLELMTTTLDELLATCARAPRPRQ